MGVRRDRNSLVAARFTPIGPLRDDATRAACGVGGVFNGFVLMAVQEPSHLGGTLTRYCFI